MTARQIIRGLCFSRYRVSFVLPNYTPGKWWECDVFEVTKNGYFVEYEVKLTRSDFLADARKGTTGHKNDGDPNCNHLYVSDGRGWKCRDCGGKNRKVVTETKHSLLAAGSTRGPCRFWYVVPAGLVKLDEIPTWAGLIEVGESSGIWIHERTIIRAPQLHRAKLDDGRGQHRFESCYWRYHDKLGEITRLERQVEKFKSNSLAESPTPAL